LYSSSLVFDDHCPLGVNDRVLCEVSLQWPPTSSSHMVKVASASCLLQLSLCRFEGPAVSSMAVAFRLIQR
jgi:hypothetical protein